MKHSDGQASKEVKEKKKWIRHARILPHLLQELTMTHKGHQSSPVSVNNGFATSSSFMNGGLSSSDDGATSSNGSGRPGRLGWVVSALQELLVGKILRVEKV